MKNTAQLRRKILGRTASVSVIGQGYVGLSLACAAAEAGFQVSGIDVDSERVGALQRGELTVAGVADDAFRAGIDSKRLTFTLDSSPPCRCGWQVFTTHHAAVSAESPTSLEE